jgi:hypothetical protein
MFEKSISGVVWEISTEPEVIVAVKETVIVSAWAAGVMLIAIDAETRIGRIQVRLRVPVRLQITTLVGFVFCFTYLLAGARRMVPKILRSSFTNTTTEHS